MSVVGLFVVVHVMYSSVCPQCVRTSETLARCEPCDLIAHKFWNGRRPSWTGAAGGDWCCDNPSMRELVRISSEGLVRQMQLVRLLPRMRGMLNHGKPAAASVSSTTAVAHTAPSTASMPAATAGDPTRSASTRSATHAVATTVTPFMDIRVLRFGQP